MSLQMKRYSGGCVVSRCMHLVKKKDLKRTCLLKKRSWKIRICCAMIGAVKLVEINMLLFSAALLLTLCVWSMCGKPRLALCWPFKLKIQSAAGAQAPQGRGRTHFCTNGAIPLVSFALTSWCCHYFFSHLQNYRIGQRGYRDRSQEMPSLYKGETLFFPQKGARTGRECSAYVEFRIDPLVLSLSLIN